MSFLAYPNYRDSGVEWLGDVPAHWSVDRIKASVQSARNGIWGGEPEGSDEDIICVRVADFDRVRFLASIDAPTMRKVTEKEREGRQLQRGDLLLEKSGGGEKQPVGAVVQYAEDVPAVCSNFVARVQLKTGMHSRFWAYVHAAAYSIRLTQGSINQTSGIQNLDSGRYFEERAPFPPLPEQIAIAAFLDRETAKIDALVEEQRRLIELLKEKRQAVISHAVTKGLDPTVPTEDSGVEWLGDVPAHWEMRRIALLYRQVAEAGTQELPILSVSIHHGVSDDEIPDDEMERKVVRSEDRSKYKAVRPNDLVYNMMRAWQGGFGTVKADGCVSPAYVVARPFGEQHTQFVEWLLRTPMLVEEMRRRSVGVADFRLRLYWEEFKDIVIPVPPLCEQRQIVDSVQKDIQRFDALSIQADTAIALLQERRAALISEAVTGKVDVRGLVTKRAEAA